MLLLNGSAGRGTVKGFKGLLVWWQAELLAGVMLLTKSFSMRTRSSLTVQHMHPLLSIMI